MRLRCPRCKVPSERVAYEEVRADLCGQCGGYWLDPGELEKIQIYWEYAQDNPDPDYLDATARKAELLAKWQQRRARQQSFADAAKALRGVARIMLGLPPD